MQLAGVAARGSGDRTRRRRCGGARGRRRRGGALGAFARRVEHDRVGRRRPAGAPPRPRAGTFRRPRSTAAGIAVAGEHAPAPARDQVAGEVAAAGVQLEHDAGRRRPPPPARRTTSAALRGAADLREAARRDGQRRGARLGDVDLGAPERRLAGERQADDARRVQAIDLAPGVRRARGVGARTTLRWTPSAPACTSSSVPGARPRASARSAGSARASSGPSSGQRGGSPRSTTSCDRRRVKTERAGPCRRSAWRDRGSRIGAGRAHRRDGRSPSARSTIAFFAARWASIETCCHWQPPQLPKSGHGGGTRSALGALDRGRARPRRPAPSRARSRARTRSPGAASGTNVARPSLALSAPGGIALAADGVAPHGQPVDLDGDLAPVAIAHVGYGKGCAERPRARLKSK